MVYIEPSIIQNIIMGKSLPFVKNDVTKNSAIFKATDIFLQNMDCRIEAMEEDDALYDLAIALVEASGVTVKKKKYSDYVAAEKAREYIHSNLDKNITMN